MNFWSNLSVKWKQIILYLLVGTIPLGVVTYINNVPFKEIQDINAANLQTVAKDIADKIDRNLFERYGDVQAFALNTILRNQEHWYQPGSPIVTSMNSYVDTYDIYYLTLLVDLEGKVIAVNEKDDSGNPISTSHIYGQNYKNAEWFQNVINKKFYISQRGNTGGDSGFTGTVITPLHIDEEVKSVYTKDDGMTIGFAAPVYDADGNVFAVWNNYAKFSLVEEIFMAARKTLVAKGLGGTELTLLDKDGNIIIDYDPTYGKGTDDSIAHDFDKVLFKLNLAKLGVGAAVEAVKGKTGFLYATHARKKIVQAGGYAHHRGALGFPGMNWSVLARTPEEVINAPIIAIEDKIMWTTAACILIIFAFGWWSSRSVTVPLGSLAERINRLANGEIRTLREMPVKSNDEFGLLARNFNSMVATLKSLLDQAGDLAKGKLGSVQALENLKTGQNFETAIDFVDEKYKGTTGDLPDAFNNMAKELRKATVQAVTISNDDLNSSVLDTQLTGELGEAFSKMNTKMKWIASQAGYIASNDLYNSNLQDDGSGTLGESMSTMVKNLRVATTEMAKTDSMMKQMPTNVMYADTDLTMQYMNPESAKTLKTLEKYLPIRVDEMVGQSIDIMHKNPAHQRRLLADPSNLPHQAQIQVGPEVLDLLVSPLFDENQNYMGPMVSWSVITEKLKAEQREKEDAEKMRKVIQHITENSQTLAGASEELTATSQQMAGNAEETSAQANVVSAASEEVSKNVQTVATGTEELNSSIREIASSANEAAKVTTEAVTMAGSTNKTISQLGESSQEIGNVIKVITSIAEQTNLLALNATIEAARAGEAGKGFAVVANEVKELANQTSKATEDISNRISAIQGDTKSAISAIGEISEVINKINDISNTIASAVEEQTATANEMSRNVEEASRGTAEISNNISGVAQAAESTTQGASDSQNAAAELARMAAELQKVVSQNED